MTSAPFGDAVAIDTNVFLHLFDSCWNTNSHIDRLLEDFQQLGIELIVDDRGRIAGEYNIQIGSRIRASDDTRNEIYVLRYWMLSASRIEIPLDFSDRLMAAIRRVVIEPSENVDRIFVYVAFKAGKLLISNDLMHIVDGPVRETSSRRQRLLRETRRHRPNGGDVLTSLEASEKVLAE